MTLFPLSPEPTNTDKQLLELINKYPQFNPIYLNVHMRDDWKLVKEFFDKEWIDFKKFADDNFYNEFQKNYSQRAWEIYLFYLFHSKGFSFAVQKKNQSNPDLKILLDNRFLFVEAVTAGKGTGVNSVETLSDLLSKAWPEKMVSRGGHIDDSNHPKVRRILSALDEKIRNYKKHQRIIAKNDFYMIAISGAEIEGSMMGDEIILEALTGINPALHIPLMKDGKLGHGFKTVRKAISNSKGSAQIDLGVFNYEAANEISAVLYFGSDTFNSILQQKSGEAVVIHNPNVIENKRINPDLLSDFRQIIILPTEYKYLRPRQR